MWNMTWSPDQAQKGSSLSSGSLTVSWEWGNVLLGWITPIRWDRPGDQSAWCFHRTFVVYSPTTITYRVKKLGNLMLEATFGSIKGDHSSKLFIWKLRTLLIGRYEFPFWKEKDSRRFCFYRFHFSFLVYYIISAISIDISKLSATFFFTVSNW